MIKKLSFICFLSALTINAIHANQNDVNAIVCASAQDTYQKINENWQYVAANKTLSTESTFWEPKWINTNSNTNGGAGRLPTLILKTHPNNIIEALTDLISKPASLECTIALTTAKLLCLKEIIGKNKFKEYVFTFHHIINKTSLSSLKSDEFFHELPTQFITLFEGNPVAGSIAYLTNLDKYAPIKPNGNSRGLNVFCVNSNLYIAFDYIFKNAPQNDEIIRQDQFESFREESDVENNEELHTELCALFNANANMFFNLVQDQQEKNFNFYQIFDETKIKEFIEEGAIEY